MKVELRQIGICFNANGWRKGGREGAEAKF